jgi:acyl carrier protein
MRSLDAVKLTQMPNSRSSIDSGARENDMDVEIQIQNRIIRFISDDLSIAEDEIDPYTNLETYGVDSLAASTLIGVLEREYDLELSAVFVFDFPTIALLSREIGRLAFVRMGKGA